MTDSFNQFADGLKTAAEATQVIPPAHRDLAHLGPGQRRPAALPILDGDWGNRRASDVRRCGKRPQLDDQ
jgi:hypothetical protein